MPYEIETWDVIDNVGTPYGLTPDEFFALIHAVMYRESNYNPLAVSPVGAIGLMQLMPGTAEEMGVSRHMLTDPYSNILAGARYLRNLIDNYGYDLPTALAAYNGGPGNRLKSGPQQYAANVLASYSELLPQSVPYGETWQPYDIEIPPSIPAVYREPIAQPTPKVVQAGLIDNINEASQNVLAIIMAGLLLSWKSLP